jgi:hypothetical protein
MEGAGWQQRVHARMATYRQGVLASLHLAPALHARQVVRGRRRDGGGSPVPSSPLSQHHPFHSASGSVTCFMLAQIHAARPASMARAEDAMTASTAA